MTLGDSVKRALCFLHLIPGLLLAAFPAPAETGGDRFPEDLFRGGGIEVGLSAGYGMGLDFGARESDEVRQVALYPRLGIGLADPIGGDAWYRGRLALHLEGALLHGWEPESGFAGGASLVLRYRLLALGRFVPYLEGGAGLLGTDLDVRSQSNGFNFALQSEAGTYYRVSRRLALTASCRYHHISNAGFERPNGGINQIQFLIGAAWFRR